MESTAVSDLWKKTLPFLEKVLPPVLAVAGFYILFGCPIKFMTGVSCPGCGMTRAYVSLLRGDVEGAFHYHPLFAVVPIGIALYLYRKRMPGWLMNTLIVAGVLLFLGVYLHRLIDPADTVVTADWSQGFYIVFWREILLRLAGGVNLATG